MKRMEFERKEKLKFLLDYVFDSYNILENFILDSEEYKYNAINLTHELYIQFKKKFYHNEYTIGCFIAEITEIIKEFLNPLKDIFKKYKSNYVKFLVNEVCRDDY